MRGKLIWSIFWTQVAVFVMVVSAMFIPSVLRLGVGLGAWVVFAGLGVTLIILTVKRKVGGMLKKSLLLTGGSAVGFTIFVLLHNIVSGLFNIEEPVFFIIATIVCPIAFLIGAVGTIVLTTKNKPASYSG